MDRRKAQRNCIQVHIEIAHPGACRCCGYADNISRTGISIVIQSEGSLPTQQRSVLLNFKIWTGSETLYRRIYARVMRHEQNRVALEFSEHDFIAEAIIQDLIFYQGRERRAELRNSQACVDGVIAGTGRTQQRAC